MPYKSLINGSKEDFNSLVSTFRLINNTLNELSFSIELEDPRISDNSADFNAIYKLHCNPATALFQIGLRKPAGFSIDFKLQDIEGYCYNRTEDAPLDFKIYFKNNILLTILRNKYSEVSYIHITTESAGFMYDSWKKE